MRKGGLYVNFERVPSTGELFQKEKHVLLGRTTIVRIGELVDVSHYSHCENIGELVDVSHYSHCENIGELVDVSHVQPL